MSEIGTVPISTGPVAYILNRLEVAPDLAKALRQGAAPRRIFVLR